MWNLCMLDIGGIRGIEASKVFEIHRRHLKHRNYIIIMAGFVYVRSIMVLDES